MLQAYDAIGKSVVQDLEHSIRLGKGRGEQLNQKCDELSRTIKMNDPVYLAEYYTQQSEMIIKTCLTDSDLPQLKEVP